MAEQRFCLPHLHAALLLRGVAAVRSAFLPYAMQLIGLDGQAEELLPIVRQWIR